MLASIVITVCSHCIYGFICVTEQCFSKTVQCCVREHESCCVCVVCASLNNIALLTVTLSYLKKEKQLKQYRLFNKQSFCNKKIKRTLI